MKRNFTIILIILAITCFASSYANGYEESDREVKTTLLKIEEELADALIKGDSSLFERHLADTVVFLCPFGNLLNKNEMTENVKYSLRMESSKREEIEVQINEQTAIVTYRSTDKGFYKFVDISGQYQWIDLFEKRNGQWQLIYQQGKPVR